MSQWCHYKSHDFYWDHNNVKYVYQLGNNITKYSMVPGLILGLRAANERRRYNVMPSLIGWTQT